MQPMQIIEILRLSPVIPVVTIDDTQQAIPLARTLLANGISVMEVTLRTEAAADAIRAINNHLPNMIVGAGTLLEPKQFELAKEAGARFVVSPGLTPPLMAAAKQVGLPYLPGAITPCEIMAARQMGFKVLKFFPAEIAGGVDILKAYLPVFPDVQFCPMGGIMRANVKEYLALKNVVAVGISWLTPKNLIEAKDWEAIGSLTEQALQ